MARNEIYRDADHLRLPVESGVESGDPVKVGSLVGVAQTDRDDDGYASVALNGAFEIDVTGAVASVGLAIYFADGDNTLTTTSGGNTLFGYSLTTKAASGAGPVTVRIHHV